MNINHIEMSKGQQNLPIKKRKELLSVLKNRFEKNMNRHQGLEWPNVQEKLEAQPEKLLSLNEMEQSGGEPDVVSYLKEIDEYIFYDCSKESPKGRRSVCYDREAQESRKKYKPDNSAIDMAADMAIELLTEEQYFELPHILGEEIDTKTSSWLQTPDEVRVLGGAIFGDVRFGRVFIYHNGAESYYGARGFRGSLRV